ncbi:MAG: CoA-binding protein [Bacteroidetes bacterium]|jgi:predicted CoA-binding protein|nr:CoA-binding protein [Bacteroidota bacterium]
MNKKTVVIGASDNPERYAYKATIALQKHNHEVVPIGIRTGIINGLEIILDKPIVPDVDTVTLYVGPQNQDAWKEYILSLKPKRVIFNPGTENPEFEKQLQEHSIEPVEACTLVMLSIGNY